MQIIKGNLWDFEGKGWLVIPTNGIRKENGEAVMGAGLAKEAAERYPDLPRLLGERLKIGNYIYFFHTYKVVTFPTKNHWKDPSDLELIIKSAVQLLKDMQAFRRQGRDVKFYLPKIGCGLGGLEWHNVWGAVRPYLDEPEFVFVIGDFK